MSNEICEVVESLESLGFHAVERHYGEYSVILCNDNYAIGLTTKYGGVDYYCMDKSGNPISFVVTAVRNFKRTGVNYHIAETELIGADLDIGYALNGCGHCGHYIEQGFINFSWEVSKMTLDEAIQHCKEVAKENRKTALSCVRANDYEIAIRWKTRRYIYEQVAEWLIELKRRREGEITEPPKTNGDKIRAMTDEELAEFIDTVTDCCSDGWMCDKCPIKSIGCDKDSFIEWLKKEVQEDAGAD